LTLSKKGGGGDVEYKTIERLSGYENAGFKKKEFTVVQINFLLSSPFHFTFSFFFFFLSLFC
jgi:hypothetical protein